MKTFISFLKDSSGVTAVEYALMYALIAVAIMATVGLLGQKICDLFAKQPAS